MISNYERLGIAPNATPEQIKAAYHVKLREFPAHTHPEEFKAVRAAYEEVRKGNTTQFEDMLQPREIKTSLDPEALKSLRSRVDKQVEVSLEDMLRLTF